jgi:hypothetical protein
VPFGRSTFIAGASGKSSAACANILHSVVGSSDAMPVGDTRTFSSAFGSVTWTTIHPRFKLSGSTTLLWQGAQIEWRLRTNAGSPVL